jgi:hypothetical protein
VSTEFIPENLRQAIVRDLRPVRPLLPPWQRTLVVAAVTSAGIAALLALFKTALRPDMSEIPMWLSWGCSSLQLLVGLALVGLALRESIPGSALPSGVVAAITTTAVLMQVVIGIATWLYSPGPVLSSGALAKGVGCMTHDTAMALPTLIATLWLVFHALPVRAPIAGLLGGAGAAVTADAITHLVCPMSDLRHVLVWHTGAMLGLMLIGWAAGILWDRRQQRQPLQFEDS